MPCTVYPGCTPKVRNSPPVVMALLNWWRTVSNEKAEEKADEKADEKAEEKAEEQRGGGAGHITRDVYVAVFTKVPHPRDFPTISPLEMQNLSRSKRHSFAVDRGLRRDLICVVFLRSLTSLTAP